MQFKLHLRPFNQSIVININKPLKMDQVSNQLYLNSSKIQANTEKNASNSDFVETKPGSNIKKQVKEALNTELNGIDEDTLKAISATRIARQVIDRLKKVDNRWKLVTDKHLNQSCPVYKYIYEICNRTINQRKLKVSGLKPSRTPTPRKDTMKDLIEMNYATSRSSSSALSEQICTEDKPKALRKASFSIDPPV